MHAPKNHPGMNMQKQFTPGFGRNEIQNPAWVAHSLGYDDRGPVTSDVSEFFSSMLSYRNSH